MDWGMFAAIVTAMGIQTALLLWMMSKLDSDIKTVASDLKTIAADSNAKWMAASSRSDMILVAMNDRFDKHQIAINQRLDANQATIIRLLEKQGK